MRKNLLPATKISSALDISVDATTDPIKVETADNVGIFIYVTTVTDNTGVFVVQIRPYKDANTYGDWIDLTLSSVPTLANADASFFINMNQLPTCQLRLKFTAAGGTPDGICDVWVSATGA